MFCALVSVVGLVVFEDAIPHADALREQLNSIYLIFVFCDALVSQCGIQRTIEIKFWNKR